MKWLYCIFSITLFILAMNTVDASSSGLHKFTYKNNDYYLLYSISNDNSVEKIAQDIEAKSFIITINSINDGLLVLDIPRTILCHDVNNNFFVLADGSEIYKNKIHADREGYSEKVTVTSRILSIPIKAGDSEIELVEGIDPRLPCRDIFDGQIKHFPKPKQQIAMGVIPWKVVCMDNQILIKKLSKDTVACVKPATAEKLVQRGWGTTLIESQNTMKTQMQMFMVSGSNFTLGYNIQEGQLTDAYYSSQSQSLILSLNTTNNNELTITLPRALIDTVKVGDQDDSFFVLTDGINTKYTEHDSTSTNRTLTIPVKQGFHKIEIIGTFLP